MKRIHYRGLSGQYILNEMRTQLSDTAEPESATECSVPQYRIYSAQNVVDEILPNHGGFIHFLGKKALKYKSIISKVPFLYQYALKYKTRLVQETQIPKDLSELFAYDQEAFIIACYREILNREPDEEGFFAYQENLCRGMPKEAVIEAFLSSCEFQNRLIVKNRKKYQKVYRTYNVEKCFKKMPIVRHFITWIKMPNHIEQLEYENRVTRWKQKTVFEEYAYSNTEVLTSLSEKVDILLRERLSNEAINNKLEVAGDKIDLLEEALTAVSELQRLLQEKVGMLYSECKIASYSVQKTLSELYSECKIASCSVQKTLSELYSVQNETLIAANNETNAVQNALSELRTAQDKTLIAVNDDDARLRQQYNSEVLVSLSEKSDFLGAQVKVIENELHELGMKSKSVFASYPGGILAVQTKYFTMGLPSEEWRLAAYVSQNGYFERGSEMLFRKLAKPTDTVIDIGANLGIYTLHAASLGCKVVSFEPTLNTFHLLNENIRVNGFFESGRIETYNFAVGEAVKDAQISIVAGISGWNNLFDSEEIGDKQPVKVVALDHQFVCNSRVDIVKIDVEGGELYVLQGMKRILTENPSIKLLMEFAPAHLRRAGTEPTALLEEIRSLGFTIQAINEENGETEFRTDEELMESPSINLYLSRCE